VASDEHLHDVEYALWIGLIADRERRPLQCCAYLNGNVDAILQPGHIRDRPGLRKDRENLLHDRVVDGSVLSDQQPQRELRLAGDEHLCGLEPDGCVDHVSRELEDSVYAVEFQLCLGGRAELSRQPNEHAFKERFAGPEPAVERRATD
jgi:hypothetical protein